MYQLKDYVNRLDVSMIKKTPARLDNFIKDSLSQFKSNEFWTTKNILKSVGVIGISFCTYYTLDIYLKRRKYSHIPGPSTKGLLGFYIGNLTEEEFVEHDILSDVLLSWHKQYGPLIKYQVSNRIYISSIDPETIKKALIGKDRFSRKTASNSSVQYFFGMRYLGSSLFTEFDYDTWKQQRAIYNQAFHREMFMTFMDKFNTKTNILLDRLRSLADDKTVVTLFPELNHAAFDTIASIICNMEVDTTNGKDMKFYDYSADILNIFSMYFQDPFFSLNPFRIPIVMDFKKKVTYLRQTVKEKILEKLNEINEQNQKDLVSMVVNKAKCESLDLEIMVDNFLLFFNGGQDTTANTLAFSFLEIAKNKEIQKKCQAEVDQVLGKRSEVTNDDIAKLKYLTGVYKETMRLYPATPELNRLAPKGAILSGYKIPCDTEMMLSTYACCRLEENFTNCLEFNPERFLDTDESSDPNIQYKYFPFGLGTQNCIGQTFAKIEIITVLAKLIQAFEIKLDPNQSLKITQGVSIMPLDGTKVFLSLRS